MAPRLAGILDDLQDSLSAIFDQAQISIANHRKNCVALYKLHLQAGAISQPVKNGAAVKLVGERSFGDVFIDMVDRVLVVKKGPAAADRIVKFIGTYVKFMNEKASDEKAKHPPIASGSASSGTIDEDDDSLASRFVSRLLKWLLQGFAAKDKTVRYRAVHIVSEMISNLGEIDEDTYTILRDGLVERICDKESFIRAHAVAALSKLVGSEDPSELQEGESTILDVLLDVLRFDPTPEVRRAALLHVPLTPTTVDTILTRTRDTDSITRKLVYSSVLQVNLGHPRQLTIAQREQVVKDGLGDREPAVRVAAGKMVSGWFDVVLAELKEPDGGETWVGDDSGVMRGFVEFLSLFDVVGPGEAIAVDAMLSIFVTRPAIPDVFVFSEEFWKELSPESAVLARVFTEHCLSTQNEARLEAASLPVVTAFAFHIQEAYNTLLEVMQDEEEARLVGSGDEEDDNRIEEEMAKGEVILGELLRMAVKLDYSDEIGRRKVFSVVRDMLAHPQLPPGLIDRCLDVLKEIMPTERELIRVVVEVVIELRDEDDTVDVNGGGELTRDDESQPDSTQTTFRKERSMRRTQQRHEMTPEESQQADMTDMRCLTLCIAMLERVHGSFEDNSTLEGILADLIIPAVKRKELGMREKGLVSLGLCCLIAKNMALSSFQLFLSQVQSAPDDLKLKVLQVVFDLLIMYDQEFFGRSEEIAERITVFLLHTLETEESDIIQAVLCIGIAKLLLAGLVTDSRVLTSLVLAYVSPATADNLELRQCLSYFFPVYCYSSPANQSRMQSVFMSAFDLLARVHGELDEDQEMISPYQFGLLMIDWTDPQKAADLSLPDASLRQVHVDVAVDILRALYDSERNDEDQKVLCQLLGHLHIMPELEARSLLKLHILLSHLQEQCPFDDPAVDKIMGRFNSRFAKLFAKDLQHIDPQQYMDDEFLELYDFIGISIPRPTNRQPSSHSPGNKPHGPKRPPGQEKAVASSSTNEEALSSATPTRKGRQKAQVAVANKSKIERKTDESDEECETSDTPDPSTPKKQIKQVRTAGSTQASPLNRKRSRLKHLRKPKTTPSLSSSDEMGSEGGTPSPIKPERWRDSTRQSGAIPPRVVEDLENHHGSDDRLDGMAGCRHSNIAEDESSDDLNLCRGL